RLIRAGVGDSICRPTAQTDWLLSHLVLGTPYIEEPFAVLAEDEEAATRFETFTPGKQRSLAHHVTSAKRTETRERRAYELARKIRTYTLHGDTPPGS
ncbi:MAG: YdeI/OmpD-associated family protein, partial [Pseudomonadota bacterium]